jgi:hypothetical protein
VKSLSLHGPCRIYRAGHLVAIVDPVTRERRDARGRRLGTMGPGVWSERAVTGFFYPERSIKPYHKGRGD